MKTVRVFAPASIANLGCGFDIMGLALDEVGDVLEMSVSEGDGLTIKNESGVPLPEDIELNVVTPVVRKFLEMTGNKAQVDVVIKRKIYPGSGIGSSSASSAAAAFGMNELFGCPLSEEDVVVCAMEGENLPELWTLTRMREGHNLLCPSARVLRVVNSGATNF